MRCRFSLDWVRGVPGATVRTVAGVGLFSVGAVLLGAGEADAAQDSTRATPPGVVVLDSLNDLPGLTIEEEGSEVHVRFNDGDDNRSIRISIDEGDDSGIVRFGEDIYVQSGEIVDGDVLAIGGNIRIAGRVEGECVAIGGSVVVEDGAVIDGDLVCIGGKLTLGAAVIDGDAVSVWGSMDESPLAEVTGDVVQVGGLGPIAWGRGWEGWGAGWGWGLPRVFTRLFWVALLIGIAFLFFHIFPDRMHTMVGTIQNRGLLSFAMGCLFWILYLPVQIALMITIVGIVAALVLFLLTPLIVLVGYIAAAQAAGLRLAGPRSGLLRSLAVGILSLEALVIFGRVIGLIGPLGGVGSFLGVLGWLVICAAATTGVGALVLTRFRARLPEPEDESADLPLGDGPEPAASR